MTRSEVIEIIRRNWDAADGCRSCGFKSCFYEHEPIQVYNEDVAQGYIDFPCFSEDASQNGGHRGMRVYLTPQESDAQA